MHRALCIYDIVEEIIDQFDSSEHADTLAHLAVTCKMFSRPALSALWYTVTFDAFIRILEDAMIPEPLDIVSAAKSEYFKYRADPYNFRTWTDSPPRKNGRNSVSTQL